MSNNNNIDNNINQSDINNLNIINSTLSIKCSGVNMEDIIEQDLKLPQGKSIAELIYDQEENRPNPQD